VRHNRALALLTIVLTAVLVGCGGSAPPAQQPGADPGEQQSYESGAIVSEQTVSGSDPAVPEGAESVRRITYMSRSAVDDSTTQVTGSVYLPAGPPPQGGRHVVAYGQAVSGSTPECALSPEAKARSSAAVGALLKAANLAPSTTEAGRLIDGGGVRVDGSVVSDRGLKLGAGTYVVQVGKRKFARVRLG
jgi:ribosome-associated protein YbcJ (S4-like RNA binding protein)